MRGFLLFPILVSTLHADPLAGAWETFDEQANTDAWLLYSYDDELSAPPPWAGPDVDANPYAYSYFLGGQAVWFFADAITAGGAFVGDYAAEKISGVNVSVSIDPSEIDFIDLAILADGPNGTDYYLSRIYQPADLGTEPSWYGLSFRFDESWFALEGDAFVPFEPDAALLASIQEVGLRVFPTSGVTSESFVGIDDFILMPTVDAPPLSTSVADSSFIMTFTPNPGVSATIETLSPSGQWQQVAGEVDLAGPQIFSTPVGPGTELFRVVTEERLTPIVAP